jgi:hypothetical protein
LGNLKKNKIKNHERFSLCCAASKFIFIRWADAFSQPQQQQQQQQGLSLWFFFLAWAFRVVSAFRRIMSARLAASSAPWITPTGQQPQSSK